MTTENTEKTTKNVSIFLQGKWVEFPSLKAAKTSVKKMARETGQQVKFETHSSGMTRRCEWDAWTTYRITPEGRVFYSFVECEDPIDYD